MGYDQINNLLYQTKRWDAVNDPELISQGRKCVCQKAIKNESFHAPLPVKVDKWTEFAILSYTLSIAILIWILWLIPDC